MNIFLLLLTAIIIAEFLCYFAYLIRYKFDLPAPLGSGIKFDTNHVYDPIKGYRMMPSTNYQGLLTNQYGYFTNSRNSDNSSSDANTYNIYIFGGSTVAGYGVSTPEETIPSVLEKLLQSKISTKIKVFNFGVGGYTSIQEFIVFLESLKHKPNLVITYDGWNDVAYSQLEPFNTFEDFNSSPFSYNYIYSKLNSEISINKNSLSFYGFSFNYNSFIASLYIIRALKYITRFKSKRYNLPPAEVSNRYLTIIDSFKSICDRNSIAYFSFLQPVLLFKNSKSTDESKNFINYEIYSNDNRIVIHEFYNKIKNFSYSNPYHIDLSQIFCDHTDQVFIDACHLNCHGNEMVSAEIFNVIKKEVMYAV